MHIPGSIFWRMAWWLLPLAILSSSLFLILSPMVPLSADLAFGITIDMATLLPFAYWLAVRKTSIPQITVVPVFILSVLLLGYLLPDTYTRLPHQIETFVFPVLELLVLGFIIQKVWAFAKAFPQDSTDNDFLIMIRQAAREVFQNGKLAQVFATEIAMFYYAFFSWQKTQTSGFTHYRKNGLVALLWAVIMILLVETFVLHIFLMRWNAAVAWIIFGLSLYGALQIFAHIRALKQRHSNLHERALHLKYGLFGDTRITLDNIESWEWTRRRLSKEDRQAQQLSLLGELEPHNLVLYLKEPTILTKAYGIKKSYTQLMLHMDEQEAFEALLKEKQNQ
ncbi:MAG TPA: hypothetical protein VJ953_18985 [Saprospiraceae bacterium]|nr:hypothetical protein [Saprospiraceae bacterium]